MISSFTSPLSDLVAEQAKGSPERARTEQLREQSEREFADSTSIADAKARAN